MGAFPTAAKFATASSSPAGAPGAEARHLCASPRSQPPPAVTAQQLTGLCRRHQCPDAEVA